MAAIFYGKILPASVAATSAQSNNPASYAALEAIGRAWYSTDLTGNDLTLNFGSAQTLAGVLLQDVNFASCIVKVSTDGVTFPTTVGTLTTYADKLTGRRRGFLAFASSSILAVRFTIAAGSSTDALTYWRVGSAYVYTSTSAFARLPDYQVQVQAIYPQVQSELANKKIAQAITGADLLTITLPFERKFDQDIFEIVRRARTGTIALAWQPNNFPELVLPVRYYGQSQAESFDYVDYTRTTIDGLREVT